MLRDWFVSLPLLTALCAQAAGVCAGEIKLLTTNYPPYFASSLPAGGPLTEIVVQAYARVGHEVHMEYVPWVRAMEHGKDGKVDGLQGAWHSAQREEWFLFSNPLPGNEVVLFKRRGDGPERFESFADLKPYTIGVVKGYRNPSALESQGLRIDQADSDATNIKKLARGRVDLILVERAVASYLLNSELARYRDELEAVEPPVEILPLYVMISKKTTEPDAKLRAFNTGLGLLAADGEIETILRKHGLQNKGRR